MSPVAFSQYCCFRARRYRHFLLLENTEVNAQCLHLLHAVFQVNVEEHSSQIKNDSLCHSYALWQIVNVIC